MLTCGGQELEPDVLSSIAEIVHHMQTREYIQANDAYLRLSIGNAPWPIGVTMVGIHERSGREKIFSNNVAHVLNDEVSRKYIQSLKRCRRLAFSSGADGADPLSIRILTFAQTKWPPSDLSQKSVLDLLAETAALMSIEQDGLRLSKICLHCWALVQGPSWTCPHQSARSTACRDMGVARTGNLPSSRSSSQCAMRPSAPMSLRFRALVRGSGDDGLGQSEWKAR